MAAEFIAKIGLDGTAFVTGITQAADKSKTLGDALRSMQSTAQAMGTAMASAFASARGGTDGAAAGATKLKEGLDKATEAAKQTAAAAGDIDTQMSKASGGGAISALAAKFKQGREEASAGGGIFASVAGTLGNLASPIGAATAGLALLGAGLSASIDIGKEFEQNLASVSAVTGLTGAPLDDLGDRARNLAKKFGGDASTQLQAFQGVLSKFGADLAKTPEQLGQVSDNINILAKAGGLDAKQSMDALANSMLQFGVNVADGKEAAAESSRFINVLAASAKVGAAEIPQVADAVLVAGVAAKGAKVSFEETNASIQVLAAGGKVGAEAGTALRNVLGKIAGEEVIPKEALAKLKSLGVDMNKVSDTSTPLSERLKELGKASKDATAFSQVFGTENAAAAKILADGAGTIQDWTKQITGTQEASVQAAKNMATFGEALSRLKANVEDVAISVYKFIAPALTFITNAIAGVLSGQGDNPFSGLMDSLKGLGSAFQLVGDVIVAVFSTELQIWFEWLKTIWGAVIDSISAAISRIGEIIQPLVDSFRKLFSTAGDGKGVMETVKTIFAAIGDVLETVLKVALGAVIKVFEGVVFVVRKVIDAITAAVKWIQDIGAAISGWIERSQVLHTVTTALGTALTNFMSTIGKVKDAVLNFLGMGDKKVEVKAEIKTEETQGAKPKEDEAAADAAAKKKKEKKEKEGKTEFERLKKELEDFKRIEEEKVNVVEIAEKKKAAAQGLGSLSKEQRLKIDQLRKDAADAVAKQADALFLKDGEVSIKLSSKKGETESAVKKLVTEAQEKATDSRLTINADIKEIGAVLSETLKKDATRMEKELEGLLKPEANVDLNTDKARGQVAALAKNLESLAADLKAMGKDDDSIKILDKRKELLEKIATAEAKQVKETRDLRIAAITDATEREAETKIAKLQDSNEKLLQGTATTEDSRKAIIKANEEEIAKIRAELNKSVFEKIGESFLTSIQEQIKAAQTESERAREASKKKIEDVENESKALEDQLAKRTITYADYESQLSSIDKKRLEAEEEANKASLDIKRAAFEAFKKTTSAALEEQAAKQLESFTESTKQGSAQFDLLAGAFAASTGAMIASGDSVGHALAASAFKALKALVPVLVAQITGISLAQPDAVATFGASAVARVTILTALLEGALSLAQSALGFAGGVVGLEGAGTSTSDSIPARLSRGESVMRADVTERERPLLQWLHEGKASGDFFKIHSTKPELSRLSVDVWGNLGVTSALAEIADRVGRVEKAVTRGASSTYRKVRMEIITDPAKEAKSRSRELSLTTAKR